MEPIGLSQSVVIGLIACALAFAVGFAIRRGSICAVAAADQWITHGRTTRMRAFLMAACWAGIVALPMTVVFPQAASLSPAYPVSLLCILGGVLFGLGAFVNGACAFGTLAHLSGGKLQYIGTIAGIVIGTLAAGTMLSPHTNPAPSILNGQRPLAGLIFILFFIVTVASTIRHYRGKNRRRRTISGDRRWRPMTAMVVIGISGGLLCSLVGQWSYMAVLSNGALQLIDQQEPTANAWTFAIAASLIAGALIAAVSSGTFALARPGLPAMAQTVTGGALMGFAAFMIPGGNDIMLLYGLPSLAPNAFIAYAAMTASLVIVFSWRRLHDLLP